MKRWVRALKKLIINGLKSLGFVFREDLSELNSRVKENDIILKEIERRVSEEVKSQFQSERIAVYTIITGDYDELESPDYIDSCCDYYCFTNNKELSSDFYKMIYIEDSEKLGNIRLQRYLKMHPWKLFPDYNYSVYIDGKMIITRSLLEYIGFFSKGASLLAFEHYKRDCIYDEGEVCKQLNKDIRETIDSQLNRYRKEGFPQHYGLIDSAVLFRRHHDEALKKHHEMWWQELKNGSKRDQLSFNYVCWNNSFEYDKCSLHIYKNSFFRVKEHRDITQNNTIS